VEKENSMPDQDEPMPSFEAPPGEHDRSVQPKTVSEGVRQQRRHIEALDGEDPLRGGVAD
jgi:hypothetical protein